MAQKSLYEILIEKGLLTKEQLQECTQNAEKSGQSIGQCLIANKAIDSVSLAKAYAEYASLPFIESITEEMADLTLLAKAPLTFLRDNSVMPIKKDGHIFIVTSNPLNFQPLDELDLLLGGGSRYAVAPENILSSAVNKYYPIEGAKEMIEELGAEQGGVALDEIGETDILTQASDAPIIKLVNNILVQAVKGGASDIHIEPFEKELRVRYRVDGVMQEIMRPPKRVQGALVSRLKIMANLNIAEKRIPQDGRIQIKVAEKAVDIRVSVLPVAHGERVVMRLLDKTRGVAKLEDIGLSERDYTVLMRDIERPNGILYITGPTGSGKTSTLYAILAVLNKPEENIITVEDPVEYQMAGVSQVQVNEKVGMTFAAALRSILRQDPDVVMIGETRDQETAQIAIQAALTGHLVLSTLHTNSAAASITRLIDMGVEPFLIASSVAMVLAQRLVRKLCEACKKPYTPDETLLSRLGVNKSDMQGKTIFEAAGCPECMESGYRGRIAIFEVMEMSDKLAELTVQRADTSVLSKQAIKDGMTFLVQDGWRKILLGVTSIEEVLAVATMDYSIDEAA